MEMKNKTVSCKRKLDEISRFPLIELNQDLLEKVLSWLPTSSFFRLTSVSKKWKSIANSPTFNLACSDVPNRQPWFLMVPSQPHKKTRPTIIFDSSEKNWKNLKTPPFQDLIPVAASGGLVCFRHAASALIFTVANPVTASSRQIPSPQLTQPILAVAMVSKSSSSENFKIVLVSGELPNLEFIRYSSGTDQWGENIVLTRKPDESGKPTASDGGDDCARYFLSKCGNVVSTDIQRSPSKQFSSVLLTAGNGDEILHFLSSSGTIVSCNLTRRFFFEYPRILPVFSEYSIDLVEVGGEMLVVLLSEFLDTASVRVWKWDDKMLTWRQVAAMPPFMSHKFYGKKADVNCAGAAGEGIVFVCVSSEEMCSYVMCDLGANEWAELPECWVDGEVNEFVTAFSFEPRIEASVWGAQRNLKV
ncbi:hypothetical protein CASFOL_007311 [Castilleja foliolosa]|uniref:F-box domain-containing protein n=1 Tax=Castilleja foliolosa TaxID=1961234 RepID=A0ABD3E8W8_9LAMI